MVVTVDKKSSSGFRDDILGGALRRYDAFMQSDRKQAGFSDISED